MTLAEDSWHRAEKLLPSNSAPTDYPANRRGSKAGLPLEDSELAQWEAFDQSAARAHQLWGLRDQTQHSAQLIEGRGGCKRTAKPHGNNGLTWSDALSPFKQDPRFLLRAARRTEIHQLSSYPNECTIQEQDSLGLVRAREFNASAQDVELEFRKGSHFTHCVHETGSLTRDLRRSTTDLENGYFTAAAKSAFVSPLTVMFWVAALPLC